MKLHTYFRSTAAYRIRIALNLKAVDYDLVPLNLFKGEQKKTEFLKLNPDGLVPVLEHDDNLLTQSMAILEYLEETHTDTPLLPRAPLERAFVRALAQTIVSDIHPLNNLRVQKYLVEHMGADESKKLEWYHHWVKQGFDGLEKRITKSSGAFCYGDSITLADVCLIPQVYNAHRFECPMNAYPNINRINQHCLGLSPFADAAPHTQPDA